MTQIVQWPIRPSFVQGIVVDSGLDLAKDANENGIAVHHEPQLGMTFRYYSSKHEEWMQIGHKYWGQGYGTNLFINIDADRLMIAHEDGGVVRTYALHDNNSLHQLD